MQNIHNSKLMPSASCFLPADIIRVPLFFFILQIRHQNPGIDFNRTIPILCGQAANKIIAICIAQKDFSSLN